jgi:ribosomal-protein-alanine N-acetyltransferase
MSALLQPQPREPYRPMAVSDLDEVLQVEAAAYPFPWTHGNFVDSLAAGYLAELRLDDTAVAGYYVAMPGFEETHLLNLTVRPELQRRGLGWSMLERVCRQAGLRGDRELWLEVRQSNGAARQLYRRFGFDESGLRRGYYPAERGLREDAVVMRLALQGA